MLDRPSGIVPGETTISHRRPIARLKARIVAALRSRRGGAAMALAIAAFAAAGLLVLLLGKARQDLFMDSAEAFTWGAKFLGGYGRHPPLTGWIAGVWYRVLPPANWASFLLSSLTIAFSLAMTFLIARRVLSARRGALIAFAMMLYPLYIGAKADHFNNYQVLLALLPLTVWLFLVAWDKRTALAGAALGLAAAAATLTIYSGGLGVAAIGLAALIGRERRAFFTSPSPYVAALVFVAALTPHLWWLFSGHDASLDYAARYAGGAKPDRGELYYLGRYFGQQLGLLAFPFGALAVALWPRRLRWPLRGLSGAPAGERRLVVVIAAVLVLAPLAAAVLLALPLQPDWGNSLFFLVPVAVLALVPGLVVTWGAVARGALLAAVWALALVVGLPVYEAVNFRLRPDYRAYEPLSELARELTTRWHERCGGKLPFVVAELEVAAPLAFYSPDHPLMMSADETMFSPWIDDPAALRTRGFIGVCRDGDGRCAAFLHGLNPQAERFDITLARSVRGVSAAPHLFHVEVSPPR
jgi:hypothetical protein